MRWLFLTGIVVCLAGCESPGPQFAGHPATRVTVEGSTFAVRRHGDAAQAIRLNREYRKGIMLRAYRAIEIGTGCAIRPGSLSGDPAVVYAKLTCAPSLMARKK